MFQRGFRIMCVLLATIVFAVMMAAASSAQQVAAQSQSAQASQKMIPLRVQLGDVDITKIACVVAYENGIYKKNGLDVQQFISKGAAEVAKSRGLTVPA